MRESLGESDKSAFQTLILWRRLASFNSAFLRRLKSMIDEMNLRTSSRPSRFTEDVGIMDGSRCHLSCGEKEFPSVKSRTWGLQQHRVMEKKTHEKEVACSPSPLTHHQLPLQFLLILSHRRHARLVSVTLGEYYGEGNIVLDEPIGVLLIFFHGRDGRVNQQQHASEAGTCREIALARCVKRREKCQLRHSACCMETTKRKCARGSDLRGTHLGERLPFLCFLLSSLSVSVTRKIHNPPFLVLK